MSTTAAPLTPRAALRWAAVAPVVAAINPGNILEIGCGQGAIGTRLARQASYLGIEPDTRSYQRAAQRIIPAGGRLLNCTDDELAADERADLVCAFDVLEHLADDLGAVQRWLRRVKPGGYLLLSVPADPAAFGPSDVLVGHYRRYSATTLDEVLAEAGAPERAIWHYGWPLGRLLDAGRDVISRRRLADAASTEKKDNAAGTAGSGRLLQPGQLAGPLIRLAVAPFARVQRWAPGRGTGLIALVQPESALSTRLPVPRYARRSAGQPPRAADPRR